MSTPETPEDLGLPDDIRPQGVEANGRHVGPGHEVSDISPRAIFGFGLGLIALSAVVVFGLAFLMNGFAARQRKSAERRPALFAIEKGQYPGPNLQDNPSADMIQMRADARDDLGGYGWADREAKVARIPIDRAMDLLTRKGLPTRAPAETPKVRPKSAAPGDDEGEE